MQFERDEHPGSPVSLTATDLSHRYLNGPAVDQVLADEQLAPVTGGYDLTTPGNVVWTLSDNEGTIRDLAVYNAQTGLTTVANHRIYDPFGKLISQTNPATGNAAAVDCLFGYTGCATDSNTDIEFHERRVKTSGSPDWLSPDPINLTSGVTNLDDYCGNDPINATDPSGLWTIGSAISIYGTTSKPVHERLTLQAAQDAGYQLNYGQRAITDEDLLNYRTFLQNYPFLSGLVDGSRNVDAPCGLANVAACVELVENGSPEWAKARYPQTFATHFGDLVYKHGMLPHSSPPPARG